MLAYALTSALLDPPCEKPALLYLVPGVLGAITLRSALWGETAALFSGTSLMKTPTSPPTPNEDGGSSDGATSADGAMWRLLKPRRSEERASAADSDERA